MSVRIESSTRTFKTHGTMASIACATGHVLAKAPRHWRSSPGSVLVVTVTDACVIVHVMSCCPWYEAWLATLLAGHAVCRGHIELPS